MQWPSFNWIRFILASWIQICIMQDTDSGNETDPDSQNQDMSYKNQPKLQENYFLKNEITPLLSHTNN